MIDVVLVRLDAPMMSFGGPMVDANGVIQSFPGLSLLVGLLGNALGVDHSEPTRLENIQDRLRMACRVDRAGERMTDFHTVDLGQAHLDGTGWTTAGVREDREGGSAKKGTHIRLREYLVDAAYTVALTLVGDGSPTLDELAHALVCPARPLFIGRKCCLPAAPLFLGRGDAPSLRSAIENAPPIDPTRRDREEVEAWWPIEEPGDDRAHVVFVADRRDWANQVHVGRRRIWHGILTVRSEPHD